MSDISMAASAPRRATAAASGGAASTGAGVSFGADVSPGMASASAAPGDIAPAGMASPGAASPVATSVDEALATAAASTGAASAGTAPAGAASAGAASTGAASPVAGGSAVSPAANGLALLSLGERLSLATRLTLSMIAAGLLAIALLWRVAFPAEQGVADLIAGAAALLVAVPVLAAAWASLRNPSLHGVSDQLVALALVGCWATGDLMTAAVLPIVMIVGHVLEERSLLGSREAIGALGQLVQSSSVRVSPGGVHESVPTQALRVGDRIALQAGDRVPVDGIIRDGAASIDTASLTGESVPVDANAGDVVLAGSINLDGRLVVEVTRVGGETTLGKIVALMHQAEAAKPPVTRLLEAYAGHYIVLVLLVSAGVWFATGDSAAMLAVLVASCPCALVLAAPATAIAAIVVAARHGILIKGSAFLEQLAEVTSVVLDKTGTVTTGVLTLVGVHPAPGVAPDALLALAAALGSASSHPVSRALAHAAPDEAHPLLTEVREERGLGMRAHDGTAQVAMGRAALLATLGATPAPAPDHDGPMVGLCRDGRFLGWLLLADQPRAEARGALQSLRDLGLHRQVLLTGDRASVAQLVGRSLGIGDICAEALPEQKMQRVMAELSQGFRPMVVGDGINDSLALKAGAVGVAMGAQGTDVALASADLVLMTSDLRRLATCVRLSRRCRRTIHVNVALGLGWTVTLIVLAACGLLGAEGAVVAAVVHNFSTLVGMANSGRLLLFDETARVDETGRAGVASGGIARGEAASGGSASWGIGSGETASGEIANGGATNRGVATGGVASGEAADAEPGRGTVRIAGAAAAQDAAALAGAS